MSTTCPLTVFVVLNGGKPADTPRVTEALFGQQVTPFPVLPPLPDAVLAGQSLPSVRIGLRLSPPRSVSYVPHPFTVPAHAPS